MQSDKVLQQYSNYDARISWSVTITNGRTLIEGHFENVRYAFMENVEVWVVMLDPGGNKVCRGSDFIVPARLAINMASEFSIEMPVAAPVGAKLVFTYKYEGSDGGDGMKWIQSFEASVS